MPHSGRAATLPLKQTPTKQPLVCYFFLSISTLTTTTSYIVKKRFFFFTQYNTIQLTSNAVFLLPASVTRLVAPKVPQPQQTSTSTTAASDLLKQAVGSALVGIRSLALQRNERINKTTLTPQTAASGSQASSSTPKQAPRQAAASGCSSSDNTTQQSSQLDPDESSDDDDDAQQALQDAERFFAPKEHAV